MNIQDLLTSSELLGQLLLRDSSFFQSSNVGAETNEQTEPTYLRDRDVFQNAEQILYVTDVRL